ncbi:MAG: exodeoxyribonuclease VII large subunit [Acidobacteriota bacterium]
MSQLGEDLRDILQHAFSGIWVMGEVHRPRPSRAGHLYFQLTEKGQGDDIVGTLDAVLFRTDHQRARRQLQREGLTIAEGRPLRCYGTVDFYPPGGRLQMIVREVDPVWGLGQLERRRRETLAALDAAGLTERNRGLPLADVPLRLGLVTSADSAAYHDFLAGLEASGFGFRVRFVHASVQGPRAEREIPSALAVLAQERPRDALDAVVVVRGGGSRSDLAAFDSRAVAEAVARSPLPVLCGLGHEIDRSIADAVCHTACKTPSAVAELLVERVADAERRVDAARSGLARAAGRQLERARAQMQRAERLAPSATARLRERRQALEHLAATLDHRARHRLATSRRALDELAAALPTAARRSIERRRDAPERLLRRLADLAAGRLARRRAELDGMARVCDQLAPERTLERGFALVQDAAGRLVRHPDQVRSGDRIHTRLDAGTIVSTVDDTIVGSTAALDRPNEDPA